MAEERFSFPPAVRGTWAEAGSAIKIMMMSAARRERVVFTDKPATRSVFNFSAFAG